MGDITYSWWNDRKGQNQTFWSGSGSTEHICQCGIDGNCVDIQLPCNCDALLPLPISDSGWIDSIKSNPRKLWYRFYCLMTGRSHHQQGLLANQPIEFRQDATVVIVRQTHAGQTRVQRSRSRRWFTNFLPGSVADRLPIEWILFGKRTEIDRHGLLRFCETSDRFKYD